jgi:hypothetical protein
MPWWLESVVRLLRTGSRERERQKGARNKIPPGPTSRDLLLPTGLYFSK